MPYYDPERGWVDEEPEGVRTEPPDRMTVAAQENRRRLREEQQGSGLREWLLPARLDVPLRLAGSASRLLHGDVRGAAEQAGEALQSRGLEFLVEFVMSPFAPTPVTHAAIEHIEPVVRRTVDLPRAAIARWLRRRFPPPGDIRRTVRADEAESWLKRYYAGEEDYSLAHELGRIERERLGLRPTYVTDFLLYPWKFGPSVMQSLQHRTTQPLQQYVRGAGRALVGSGLTMLNWALDLAADPLVLTMPLARGVRLGPELATRVAPRTAQRVARVIAEVEPKAATRVERLLTEELQYLFRNLTSENLRHVPPHVMEDLYSIARQTVRQAGVYDREVQRVATAEMFEALNFEIGTAWRIHVPHVADIPLSRYQGVRGRLLREATESNLNPDAVRVALDHFGTVQGMNVAETLISARRQVLQNAVPRHGGVTRDMVTTYVQYAVKGLQKHPNIETAVSDIMAAELGWLESRGLLRTGARVQEATGGMFSPLFRFDLSATRGAVRTRAQAIVELWRQRREAARARQRRVAHETFPGAEVPAEEIGEPVAEPFIEAVQRRREQLLADRQRLQRELKTLTDYYKELMERHVAQSARAARIQAEIPELTPDMYTRGSVQPLRQRDRLADAMRRLAQRPAPPEAPPTPAEGETPTPPPAARPEAISPPQTPLPLEETLDKEQIEDAARRIRGFMTAITRHETRATETTRATYAMRLHEARQAVEKLMEAGASPEAIQKALLDELGEDAQAAITQVVEGTALRRGQPVGDDHVLTRSGFRQQHETLMEWIVVDVTEAAKQPERAERVRKRLAARLNNLLNLAEREQLPPEEVRGLLDDLIREMTFPGIKPEEIEARRAVLEEAYEDAVERLRGEAEEAIDFQSNYQGSMSRLRIPPDTQPPDAPELPPSEPKIDLVEVAQEAAQGVTPEKEAELVARTEAAARAAEDAATAETLKRHDITYDPSDLPTEKVALQKLPDRIAEIEAALSKINTLLKGYYREPREIAEMTGRVLKEVLRGSYLSHIKRQVSESPFTRAIRSFPGWEPEHEHFMKNTLAAAHTHEMIVREGLHRLLGEMSPEERLATGLLANMHPHRLRIPVYGKEAGEEIVYSDAQRLRAVTTFFGMEPVDTPEQLTGSAAKAWRAAEELTQFYNLLYFGGVRRPDGTVARLHALPSLKEMSDQVARLIGEEEGMGFIPAYVAIPRLREDVLPGASELSAILRSMGFGELTAKQMANIAYGVMHPAIERRALFESGIDPIMSIVESLAQGKAPEPEVIAELRLLDPLLAGEWYARQVGALTVKQGVVRLLKEKFPNTAEIMREFGEKADAILQGMRRDGWQPLHFGDRVPEGLEDILIPPEYQEVILKHLLLGVTEQDPVLRAYNAVVRDPWDAFRIKALLSRNFLNAQLMEVIFRLALHGATPREAAESAAISAHVMAQTLVQLDRLAPSRTLADRIRVKLAESMEWLGELLVQRQIVTPEELAQYIEEFRMTGITESSVGASAIEASKARNYTEWFMKSNSRLLRWLGAGIEELNAIAAAFSELIFGWDKMHRSMAYVILRRRGFSAEAARAALREKSAEYGAEAMTPIQKYLQAIFWYSTFNFQLTQQLAKLSTQRPGVALAIARATSRIPEHQGFDEEERYLIRAGTPYLGIEWVPVRKNSLIFPDDTVPGPTMLQHDGPHFLFLRLRIPSHELVSTLRDLVTRPVESVERMAPPTVSILARAERTGKYTHALRLVPVLGRLVRPSPVVTGNIFDPDSPAMYGTVGLDFPEERFREMINAEETHREALRIAQLPSAVRATMWANYAHSRQVPAPLRAPRKLWAENPAEAQQLELERMIYFYKLHQAANSSWVSIAAIPVEELVRNATIPELEGAMAVAKRKLENGEQPVALPEVYELELQRRKAGLGPRYWWERYGGLGRVLSRTAKPAPPTVEDYVEVLTE